MGHYYEVRYSTFIVGVELQHRSDADMSGTKHARDLGEHTEPVDHGQADVVTHPEIVHVDDCWWTSRDLSRF